MPTALDDRPAFGAAAVTSLLSGVFVLCAGLVNNHPFTEGLFYFTVLVGVVSAVSAVLSVIGAVRRRVRTTALILAVIGPVAAFLGISIGWAVLDYISSVDTSFLAIPSLPKDNLTQIASALREYEKANGHLPPTAVYGEHGEALLSWRILVLPYLGQDDLFKQFKLDEAWDSPNNLSLLDKMPAVFTAPGRATAPSTTFYQVFVGPGTAFEGRQGVRLADFPDGLDKTFLVVEAREAVPWTKPADLTFDPAGPLPKLGDVHGFAVALADGSERYVTAGTSEATLRAAITRNGGDKLGPDW